LRFYVFQASSHSKSERLLLVSLYGPVHPSVSLPLCMERLGTHMRDFLETYTHRHTHTDMYVYVCVYVYIYIIIEREREGGIFTKFIDIFQF